MAVATNNLAVVTGVFGWRVLDPISKTLVCGDTGLGAMAEVQAIVEAVRGILTIDI